MYIYSEQIYASANYLINPKNRALVEKRYGNVTETAILYRGKPGEERGVSYQNVNDYWKGVAAFSGIG